MDDDVTAYHGQARMEAIEAHVLGAIGIDDHVAYLELISKADGFCWISCSALSTVADGSPAWAKALRLAMVIAAMGSRRDNSSCNPSDYEWVMFEE